MNASLGEHGDEQKQATTKLREVGCEVRLQRMKLPGNALAQAKGYLVILRARRHPRRDCLRPSLCASMLNLPLPIDESVVHWQEKLPHEHATVVAVIAIDLRHWILVCAQV